MCSLGAAITSFGMLPQFVFHQCLFSTDVCVCSIRFNRVIALSSDESPPRPQADNRVMEEVGAHRPREPWMLSHPELLTRLGIVDLEAGVAAAGGRGYYLLGQGVMLNQV